MIAPDVIAINIIGLILILDIKSGTRACVDAALAVARTAYRSLLPLHERTIVDEWRTIEGDIAGPHQDV